MEDHANLRDRVAAAARRGARTVSRTRHVEHAAVEFTLDLWVDREVDGPRPVDVEAWAFEVAANEARKIHSRELREVATAIRAAACRLPAMRDDLRAMLREVLLLPPEQSPLTERQREVALSVVSSATLREVAREVGMEPSNLKRTLRRIERRFRQWFRRHRPGGGGYPGSSQKKTGNPESETYPAEPPS